MPAIGFKPAEATPEGASWGEKKEFVAIPAGTYPVEIVNVKFQYVNKEICDWKKYDEEIVFEFVIKDGEGDAKNRHFWKDVPAYLTDDEGCRLRLILQEIIGVNSLPLDFVFDTDDLDEYKGLPCRIRVNQYMSKKKGKVQNGVDEVLAALPSQFKKANDLEEPF